MDRERTTGTGVFGPAYRRMLDQDVHAPGSVDRVLLEHMTLVTHATRSRLYAAPCPVQSSPAPRPALERTLADTGVSGIVAFTASLCDRAPARLEDMRFGGTEEEIVTRGSEWCTDLARVACVLHQLAGVPARIVYLVDLAAAYSCHVVVEARLESAWVRLDAVTGEPCPEPDPRAAAVAEYPIAEHDRFDYAVSGISEYYRAILEMAEKGWPGGLRWLFDEDD